MRLETHVDWADALPAMDVDWSMQSNGEGENAPLSFRFFSGSFLPLQIEQSQGPTLTDVEAFLHLLRCFEVFPKPFEMPCSGTRLLKS